MVFRYLWSQPSVQQVRQEMDRLLSGHFGDVAGGLLPRRGQPAVNVWEREDSLFVELEVPGVKTDQVDISVIEDELSIKIQRPEVEREEGIYHRRERGVGTFSRVMRLPVSVDADRVEAELRNGVLTITLPKAESARLRKIEVTSAS